MSPGSKRRQGSQRGPPRHPGARHYCVQPGIEIRVNGLPVIMEELESDLDDDFGAYDDGLFVSIPRLSTVLRAGVSKFARRRRRSSDKRAMMILAMLAFGFGTVMFMMVSVTSSGALSVPATFHSATRSRRTGKPNGWTEDVFGADARDYEGADHTEHAAFRLVESGALHASYLRSSVAR